MAIYNYDIQSLPDGRQTAIRITKPSGECLILTFPSDAPQQAPQDYLDAIGQVMQHHPEGLMDEYNVLFSRFLARNRLEAPISVSYDLNIERTQFCARIRQIREKNGMTIQQLADKAGISAADLTRLEQALPSPDIDALIKIAKTFEAQLDIIETL